MKWMSNMKIAKKLYLGFSAVCAVVILLVTVAYVNFSSLGAANKMNVHTYEVLDQSGIMLASLINMETGERGFAITGNDAFLDPLNAGKTEFGKSFDQAKKLTSDNPRQQERLAKLQETKDEWVRLDVKHQSARSLTRSQPRSALEANASATRKAVGHDLAMEDCAVADSDFEKF